MIIFPSDNEKTITVVIVTFIIGSLIGVFIGTKITDSNILLPALATLAAAFIGAWAAYKLEDNKKKREHKEKCLENANTILFALYERIKALKCFQRDFIEPHRSNQLKMITMMPALDFSYPQSEFNVESLLFLLKTKHSQLMLDLHTEKECFIETFKLIRFRSNLHFNNVQPAIETAGIVEGGTYTRAQMITVVGERIFAQIERATDGAIENVDKTIVQSLIVKARLVSALKEIFPNEKLLNFELISK